ncbi:MAG: 6-phosphofructokinase [Deltaproteobacteria bacterium]|nr:6-phosphofructokinase [Deltaproteobacteria bacterium]
MKSLGVFVSGGPGPGINACLAGIYHHCCIKGVEVVGLKHSFKSFFEDWRRDVVKFSNDLISEIQFQGGSYILCSRANPLIDSHALRNFEEFLDEMAIRGIVVIGGDGSTFLSNQIKQRFENINIVVCPKTIDNDLPLPNFAPTLGFSTARNVGSELVQTMINDASSSERWFIVTCMGRNTGFLSAGVTISSGAQGLLIPEEFSAQVSLAQVVDAVMNVIETRMRAGKGWGVYIVAEGILSKLDDSILSNAPRDQFGRYQYREFPVGDLIVHELKKSYRDQIFIHKDLGFELRGARPLAYDVEYGFTLGWGAVKFIEMGLSGIVFREWQETQLMPFSQVLDSNQNVLSRRVDVHSEYFKLAKNCSMK